MYSSCHGGGKQAPRPIGAGALSGPRPDALRFVVIIAAVEQVSSDDLRGCREYMI